MRIEIPGYVRAIIDRLRAAGKEAYIVGGSLRDSLLGGTPSDYDLTTSALPSEMLEIFSGYRVIETGLQHGTLTVLSEGRPIEITTFRIDGGYTDSRHPDSVSFTRSLEEDLARRDFTVNAMAYSEERGLVDLFGGVCDLEKRIIRAVGEPKRRFSEDALRIMRAFRFSAQLGFCIDGETLSAAVECREGLSRIACERIFTELLRLLHSPFPEEPLRQMRDVGILGFALGDHSPSDRVISLISSAPCNGAARLGVLLLEAEEDQRREILAFLKCSNKQKSGAMAVARGAKESVATDGEISRFLSTYGANATDALAISVLLGNSNPEALTKAEQNRAPRSIRELAVNGEDLSALGLEGREIGKMLALLFERALDEPQINTRETLLAISLEITEKRGK